MALRAGGKRQIAEGVFRYCPAKSRPARVSPAIAELDFCYSPPRGRKEADSGRVLPLWPGKVASSAGFTSHSGTGVPLWPSARAERGR